MTNKQEKLKRKHVIQVRLNDLELQALSNYCKSHRIDNKAALTRAVLMEHVVADLTSENSSSLF